MSIAGCPLVQDSRSLEEELFSISFIRLHAKCICSPRHHKICVMMTIMMPREEAREEESRVCGEKVGQDLPLFVVILLCFLMGKRDEKCQKESVGH